MTKRTKKQARSSAAADDSDELIFGLDRIAVNVDDLGEKLDEVIASTSARGELAYWLKGIYERLDALVANTSKQSSRRKRPAPRARRRGSK